MGFPFEWAPIRLALGPLSIAQNADVAATGVCSGSTSSSKCRSMRTCSTRQVFCNELGRLSLALAADAGQAGACFSFHLLNSLACGTFQPGLSTA